MKNSYSTSNKTEYSEKLLDPRWQKKRLEILQRDGFTCQFCLDTTKTLHVHHFTYMGDPWEVNNINLVTLCKDCHQAETDNRGSVEHDLLLVLKQRKIKHDYLYELVTGFIQTDADLNDDVAIGLIKGFLQDKLKKEVDKYYKKEAASIHAFLARKEAEKNG